MTEQEKLNEAQALIDNAKKLEAVGIVAFIDPNVKVESLVNMFERMGIFPKGE